MMRFYLGAHHPGWLSTAGYPLFVSHRRLATYRRLPIAAAAWALDSGGFTELSMFGQWRTTARQYLTAMRRYVNEVGYLQWAAPQDWMCEPLILAKTGQTVAEHQRRTVDSFLQLRSLAPDLPVIPVLQGWDRGDYLRCVDLYAAAGVDLPAEPLVGVGSICRRQHTAQITDILSTLASAGLQLHGFGVKTAGLSRYGPLLASADSMAWSYTARRLPALPGCRHQNCANCPRFATRWRTQVLAAAPRWYQPGLQEAS